MIYIKKNKYDEKSIGGCAISGIINEDGTLISGDVIITSIANMHERANGLGGGFAAYGIYPEFKDKYAFHIMYEEMDSKALAEEMLKRYFILEYDEEIPTTRVKSIKYRPILWRYFLLLKEEVREKFYDETEEDIVVRAVMDINTKVEGAFVFSSGKNMGIFKGVGYPEDIGEFFKLHEYKGYLWTAHGRFPTNTEGWWGGAHPFGILNWSVVHNGEISSYGINIRYLENFGYYCTLQTDTEAIAYLFDLLVRKHKLPLEFACMAMAPPFWDQIERMPENLKKIATAIRIVYGGALLNGPFSVIVAYDKGLIGFNDRIKLRPMVAARKGNTLYIASEESAIRVICKNPDSVWQAEGGVPIIGELKKEVKYEESCRARISN